MPFARVGAMPQTNQHHQRNVRQSNGGDGSARHKGITMEDLKKQTALRLASEQQQHHQGRGAYQHLGQHRDRPLRTLSDQAAQAYPGYAQPDVYKYSHPHGFVTHQPGYQLSPHHGTSMVHSFNGFENHSSAFAQTGSQGYEQSLGNKLAIPRDQRLPQHQHPGQLSPHGTSGSPKSRYAQDQRTRFQRANDVQSGHCPAPPIPADFDMPSQSSGNGGKSKLPHGLTVHELKEMTKARLQAEAADDGQRGLGYDQRGVSPLDFDVSISEGRDRAFSRDSASRNQVRLNHGQASDSMTSIPSLVQVNPPIRDQQHQQGRQPQVSPLPPGFQNFGGSSNPSLSAFLEAPEAQSRSSLQDFTRPASATRDSWQPHPKGEAWESASVTSHNSTVVSEYLGSESAYSAGVPGITPQPSEEMGGVAFNRSRSYSATAPHSFENAPASDILSYGNSFFDTAVGSGPNRMRSYTSPQPSLIHEDRPHFSGENFGLPNFSSGGRHGSLSRSRHNYSSVLPHTGVENSRYGHNPGGFGGALNDFSNRPRTSSTTSLPPMSRTAEEFALDRSVQASRFSASQPFMGAGPITEEDYNAATELAFHLPYVSMGRDGPAENCDSVTSPPGIFGTAPSLQVPGAAFDSSGNGTTTMRSPGDAHDVSAAWDVIPAATSVDEMLSSDLGSILKLSGVTDRHDRD